MDAIVHVVRCFADDSVVHVDGATDPARDMGVVETELVMADLEAVMRRIHKVELMLEVGRQEYALEMEVLSHLRQTLEAGTPLRQSAAA